MGVIDVSASFCCCYTVTKHIQDIMGVSDVSASVCSCVTVTTCRQDTMGVAALRLNILNIQLDWLVGPGHR